MAATRTAQLRLQLLDSVSGPSKTTTAALRNLESSIARLGKGGVPGAKNLGNQLEYLRQKADALRNFRDLRRDVASAFGGFRQARTRVQELERALANVTKPTAKMRADLRSAQSALRAASGSFKEHRAAARSAEQALRSFGVNSRNSVTQSQTAIRSQMAKTIQKMREMDREAKRSADEQRRQSRGGGGSTRVGPAGVVGGVAGGYAAHRSASVAREAFQDAVSFDQAVMYRDALGGAAFNKDEQGRMNQQAERIGYETRFTNADVVRGQVGVLQAGIRDADVIMNLMQPITDYALAMNTTLEEATETVRASSQIRQIPLGDIKAITTFVDSLVWMAKNAGMNDSDVRQYIRYGGGSMKGLGISDETASAIGIVLRRAGTPGDEAGVFARTAAAKLGAPTNPGRLALQAMGLNYDDYVTQPDAFKVTGLAKAIQEGFGVRIPEEMRKQISKFIEEETFFNEDLGEEMPVGSDRGVFTSGIMDLISPILGGLSPMDRKVLAKKIGDFHKFSAESVDSERLLMDILASDPTTAQLNAFFTQRQGNRARILSSRYKEFLEAQELMHNTPDGLARQIGHDANKGLYGDWTRATGAIETALIKVVKDWEGPISTVLKSVDYLASEFTQLSGGTRRLIEAFGVAASIFGGYAATRAGRRILGGVLGGGRSGSGPTSRGKGGGRGKLVLGRKGAIGLGLIGAIDSVARIPSDKEELEEFIRQNHEASDEMNKWLEENIGTPYEWFGLGKKDEKGVPRWKRLLLGDAADPEFSFRKHMGVKNTASPPDGPDAATISRSSGTSTTQKAGNTNVNAPMSAPISLTFNGVTLEQTIAAARQAAQEVVDAFTRQLDASLSRSSQIQYGGIGLYGDQ